MKLTGSGRPALRCVADALAATAAVHGDGADGLGAQIGDDLKQAPTLNLGTPEMAEAFDLGRETGFARGAKIGTASGKD